MSAYVDPWFAPSTFGWFASGITLCVLYVAMIRGLRAWGPEPTGGIDLDGILGLVVFPVVAAFVWPLGLALTAWMETVTRLRTSGRIR